MSYKIYKNNLPGFKFKVYDIVCRGRNDKMEIIGIFYYINDKVKIIDGKVDYISEEVDKVWNIDYYATPFKNDIYYYTYEVGKEKNYLNQFSMEIFNKHVSDKLYKRTIRNFKKNSRTW